MARLPALDVLSTMDDAWRAAYRAALPGAQRFMTRLPLVRVVVPEGKSSEERKKREQTQIEEIFRRGRLSPSHESDNTHSMAKKLEVPHSLYLHGGRTHPDYGRMALVFNQVIGDDSADATPFGLGGLLCPATGRWHDEGACTAPVAHDPEADQVAFVRDSRWTANWRDRAGEFLAAYYESELERYFLPGIEGKPLRPDPAGIYTDGWCRDWRSWTLEVRLAGDVDLFELLA